MSARARFLAAVERQLGMPVLWGAKEGPARDCSGSVTVPLKEIGGPDLTHIDTAQGLHDETRVLGAGPSDTQLPGDLAFYGVYEKQLDGYVRVHIVHVAVLDEYGGVISADGATSSVTSLAMALANPANRVRRHSMIRYRHDTPVVVVHRNTIIDKLDEVSR